MIWLQPRSDRAMTKILLFLAVFSLGLVASCKKQQQTKGLPTSTAEDTVAAAAPAAAVKKPEAQANAADKLPGASVIREDLRNKSYAKAVERLLVLRGYAAANSERWTDYRELCGEVGQALAAAAQTDENAAQALASYRVAMYGR